MADTCVIVGEGDHPLHERNEYNKDEEHVMDDEPGFE